MNQFNTRNQATLPYEKCLRYGAGALTDAELLAILIRSGTAQNDCLEVAETILRLSGPMGILGLKHLSYRELMTIDGIGSVKAIMLQCVAEISNRIAKTAKATLRPLRTPQDVADLYSEELRHLEQERFLLLMLDTKSCLIHESVLSIGTINYTCVSSREIFREALKYGAVYLILLHNHPSGDPSPSGADIRTTRLIREAGELIGIPLIDHIIIGDPTYLSMKEQSLLD